MEIFFLGDKRSHQKVKNKIEGFFLKKKKKKKKE